MLSTQRFKKKRFWGSAIIIAVLIALIWSVVLMFNHQDESGIVLSSETTDWNTYLNQSFGFSVDFPKGWMVYEDFKSGPPSINIYEPRFGVVPPFDQFSNVNTVSIYPTGTETELIIGKTRDAKLNLLSEANEMTDYVLSSGDVWATHISFEDTNESWTPWGFIWARLMIDGSDYHCERDGSRILVEDCNPLGGDDFVRDGEVDMEIRETEVKILESFRFITN